MSLPVRGAWIEISQRVHFVGRVTSRSPCGERGLKFVQQTRQADVVGSLPVRGAWIEILQGKTQLQVAEASLPVRGAWIEIAKPRKWSAPKLSLPVRGAWIEMCAWMAANDFCACRSPCGERGLKYHRVFRYAGTASSLPVRGAWIEILKVVIPLPSDLVAPRAGSVD